MSERLEDMNLVPPKGARKKRKRIGRGDGSGHGTYSTRGIKGSRQRKGKEYDARFEGGQTPLHRRIPKRGFTNIFKKVYEIVNLKRIEEKFSNNEEVNPETLRIKGLVKKDLPVKILGDGNISKPLVVKAHAFSKSAKEKIEKAGGKVEVIAR